MILSTTIGFGHPSLNLGPSSGRSSMFPLRSSRCCDLSLVLIIVAGSVFAALLAPIARSQVDSGTFVGTVRDASGGVVSGAAVTVTSV